MRNWVGGPATGDATILMGLPVMPEPVAVAVSVSRLAPAVCPRCHEVTVAVPLGGVMIGVVGETTPPPPVTWNVTGLFWIGLLNLSARRTCGAIGTGCATVSVCAAPAVTV